MFSYFICGFVCFIGGAYVQMEFDFIGKILEILGKK